MDPNLFPGWLPPSRLAAIAQVLVIDVTLAGDNAVVLGLAVGALRPRDRVRAIAIGVAGATVARVALALVAVRLLALVGLTLAGGLLLLWVAWRSWRELRGAEHAGPSGPSPASFGGALARIALADISMSLDNVLAVAGAARNDPLALAIGLVVAIVLTAVAATVLAALLQRHRWLAFVGIAIVLFVALRMIWDGGHDVLRHAIRL